MLKRVDRVQIAVANCHAAEDVVGEIFGGELVRRDRVALLCAKRSTMQAGASLIEILEPDGAGPVQDFTSKWSSGLFGAGFSVDDPGAAAHHLAKCGVSFEQSAGQLYLDAAATFGMRTVISQHHERAAVGALKWMYEITNVVGDWKAASDHYARIFGLDAAKFSPIESKEFGYIGTLTLFDVLCRDRRCRRTRTAPAGARRPFRGESPRRCGAGRTLYPSLSIPGRPDRSEPHRACMDMVRRPGARASRREAARAHARNSIEMKPLLGFTLPWAGVAPAP